MTMMIILVLDNPGYLAVSSAGLLVALKIKDAEFFGVEGLLLHF